MKKKGNVVVVIIFVIVVIAIGSVVFLVSNKNSKKQNLENRTTEAIKKEGNNEASKYGKYELIHSMTPEKLRNMSSEELVRFRKLKKEFEQEVKEGKIKPIVPKYIEVREDIVKKDIQEFEETNKEKIKQMRLKVKEDRINSLKERIKIAEKKLKVAFKRFEGNWLENYEKELRESYASRSGKIDEEVIKEKMQEAIDNEYEKQEKESIEDLKKLIVSYEKEIEETKNTSLEKFDINLQELVSEEKGYFDEK